MKPLAKHSWNYLPPTTEGKSPDRPRVSAKASVRANQTVRNLSAKKLLLSLRLCAAVPPVVVSWSRDGLLCSADKTLVNPLELPDGDNPLNISSTINPSSLCTPVIRSFRAVCSTEYLSESRDANSETPRMIRQGLVISWGSVEHTSSKIVLEQSCSQCWRSNNGLETGTE